MTDLNCLHDCGPIISAALIWRHMAGGCPVNIGHEIFLNACCAPCFVQVSYFGSITLPSLAIAVDVLAAFPIRRPISFAKTLSRKDLVLKRFRLERLGDRTDEWPPICPRSSWNIFAEASA